MFSAFDHDMMARALRLAEEARYWARPNPHVGCVLVRDECVVGEGFTQPAGGHHAEVQALRSAGDHARGSTAYVSLEPCAHHGRTPPCAEALLNAGVSRVVAALQDPNPRVDGGGFALLRDAGVSVQTGLLESAAERQLAGFILRQRRGRGRLRLKLAMSLDGRTAMASGESQWITGSAARRDVQRLRAESCAIITGIGTVLADDCALLVRDRDLDPTLRLAPPARRALRVVLDGQLRTPCGARVLAGEQPTLLVHGAGVPVLAALAGEEHLALPTNSDGLPLAALLDELGRREKNEILLESGPTLAGAMLQAGLVDELIVYIAPRLLGSRARPLLELPLDSMAEAMDLALIERRQVGDDLRLTFAPQKLLEPKE
ncbi:MAG: diaminohydroxyphosphoribosylaminopyrimidine deaminase [Halieaceae bacterium]|jgi:diaminohydroxyphosphoribosylaminopyrimidine deaminase/5-amino-6-(5-phosphoribosylamino)uracil reductase